MSAADSRDRDLPGFLPQDSLPIDLAAFPKASPGTEDWQTVDCPGAMSVDAIPKASAESPSSATPAEPLGELTQLKRENMELRDRTAQLEQDFTQGQVEWQLETARLLHQMSENTSPEQAQAVQVQLASAHEQLSRLFRELELCHQTAQRQQILVETLTEQLESGQERIAELERDCATTQQRYNEQVQQRLQAEASCRDLRIRLNRQQQHTLQFKVALEKCLEMPSSGGRSNTELDLSNVLASPFEPLATESIVANQSSPVQPWSAPANQMSLKPTLSHLLPNDLGIGGQIQPPSIDSGSSSQDNEHQDASELMNLIFPSSESPVPAIANDSAQVFFDIQPLLETEALLETEDGTGVSALSNQIQQASDVLWQDLTALIDLPIPETYGEGKPDDGLLASVVSELPCSFTDVPRSISQSTLQALGLPGATNNLKANDHPTSFSVSPSPVVYPLRPTKRLASLAAVELPTFPRKN